MNKLEQSFADIRVAHNLTSLSVEYRPGGFTSYAHAKSGDVSMCASGHGDTISEAITAAIHSLAVKRGAVPAINLADEPLAV